MHVVNSKLVEKEGVGRKLDFEILSSDVNFLSFAQSDISSLASAVSKMESRLNFSISSIKIDYLLDNDTLHHWLEINRTTKLIVARVLGGETFFKQGIKAINQAAKDNNFKVLYLSGDERFIDHDLEGLSSLRGELANYINNCWQNGGIQNISLFLEAVCKYVKYIKTGSALDSYVVTPISIPQKIEKIKIDNSYYYKDYTNQTTIFAYLSWYLSGDTQMIKQLSSILNESKISVRVIYLASIRDNVTQTQCYEEIVRQKSSIVVTALGFSFDNVFVEKLQIPIIQVNYHLQNVEEYEQIGLSPSEVIMQVVMPEFNGRFGNFYIGSRRERIFSKQINCYLSRLEADRSGCEFLAKYISNFLKLTQLENKDKKIAITLANYPSKDGKIANGVGLDTLKSLEVILQDLVASGYDHRQQTYLKITSKEIIDIFLKGPTNQTPKRIASDKKLDLDEQTVKFKRAYLSLTDYLLSYNHLDAHLRDEIEEHFGKVEDDRFYNQEDSKFHLSIFEIGNFAIGIQPTRGWEGIDSSDQVHDPHLPPNHAYLAFYFYLGSKFGAQAIIEPGKHGSLEWLPGKATALSEYCFPKQTLGPIPFFYPFIVNDPGEGSQAKRRSSAVILDHLPPKPLLAGDQDKYIEIEAWIDELSEAKTLDPRRAHKLMHKIIDKAEFLKLDIDCKFDDNTPEDIKLTKLDKFLCELKDLQVRDGLHVFGQDNLTKTNSDFEIKQTAELLVLSGRVDRGSKSEQTSIINSLMTDLKIEDKDLDLLANTSKLTNNHEALKQLTRKVNDLHLKVKSEIKLRRIILSRESLNLQLTLIAKTLVENYLKDQQLEESLLATNPVIVDLISNVLPLYKSSPKSEITNLIKALDGKHIRSGPSGAPSRGRIDVLPTGKNFYSVDPKSIPSLSAVEIGQTTAKQMLQHFFDTHKRYPRSLVISSWGTSTMRTSGDDLASALALIGAQVEYNPTTLRVEGFKIIPQTLLGRPRIDVTLRVSGFFRDAFPNLISLFAKTMKRIMKLDESIEVNYIKAHYLTDLEKYKLEAVNNHTALDKTSTAIDKTSTAINKSSTAINKTSTALDKSSTAIDKTSTALDKTSTAIDKTSTALDKSSTAIDKTSTAINKSSTALDKSSTAIDKTSTAIDKTSTAINKSSTALDKTKQEELASYRVFSSAQGSYGAGINSLIDSGSWKNTDEISELFINWASFGYSDKTSSKPAESSFRASLAKAEVVVQNQDNREHDILDSDDYYQFQGGLTLAVSKMSKKQPITFLNDTSNPANIKSQTLDQELARVVRGRVCNQNWIDKIKKHGYRGAAEMSASLDYLFAFAVTTKSVSHHFFDLVYEAYIENINNQDFLKKENIDAYKDILNKFKEALDRGLWHPKSNQIPSSLLEKLQEFDV